MYCVQSGPEGVYCVYIIIDDNNIHEVIGFTVQVRVYLVVYIGMKNATLSSTTHKKQTDQEKLG